MKRIVYLTCIACLLLLIANASGAADITKAGIRPVTVGNFTDQETPPPFGNVPGGVIDDKVYRSLAPCYVEYAIKSYGTVPVFTPDHTVVSRGILAEYSTTERNALFKKLGNVYESTKDSVTGKYGYPDGPVISYGYDALGSMVVGIYEKASVDEKTLDEMHTLIAGALNKEGIGSVPVLFYAEPIPELELGRSDTWRPVIGGVQASTSTGYFTSGFAATIGSQTGFVTTGHAGGVGTTIYQPNLATPIGSITISSNGATSDSSWVSYSNSAGQIFESSSSQPWIYGWSDPSEGLNIYMSGVTSGVASGTVLQRMSVWSSYFGKSIDNQWSSDYSSAEGDSGAPVYYKDASQHIQLTGLHWARTRYAIFSPITNVLNDL